MIAGSANRLKLAWKHFSKQHPIGRRARMNGMRCPRGWPSVRYAARQGLESHFGSVSAALGRLSGTYLADVFQSTQVVATCRPAADHVSPRSSNDGKRYRDAPRTSLLKCHANTKLFAPNDVTLQPQAILLHDQHEVRRNMDQVGYVQRGPSHRQIEDTARNFSAADFDRCRLRNAIARRNSSFHHPLIPTPSP